MAVLWTVGLFPWPSLLAQWAHKQSGHGGGDENHAWTRHVLPLTKADLAPAAAQRPALRPRFVTIPWGMAAD